VVPVGCKVALGELDEAPRVESRVAYLPLCQWPPVGGREGDEKAVKL
jgi:hypothetical protein